MSTTTNSGTACELPDPSDFNACVKVKVPIEVELSICNGLFGFTFEAGDVHINGETSFRLAIPAAGNRVGVVVFPDGTREENGYSYIFVDAYAGIEAAIDKALEIRRERCKAEGSEFGRTEGAESSAASGSAPEHEGHGEIGVGESEG